VVTEGTDRLSDGAKIKVSTPGQGKKPDDKPQTSPAPGQP
jgi:hypothetical protein